MTWNATAEERVRLPIKHSLLFYGRKPVSTVDYNVYIKVGFEFRPENAEQTHLECRDRNVEIDRLFRCHLIYTCNHPHGALNKHCNTVGYMYP